MMRAPASVRARTTLAATAVVAVALVATGVAVVVMLRGELRGQSALEARTAARDVAGRLAGGTPVRGLDLPGDRPVRVLDDDDRVVAASRGLTAVDGRRVRIVAERPGENDEDDGEVGQKTELTTGTATVNGTTAEYRFASVEAETPDGREFTVVAGVARSAERAGAGTAARALLAGLLPLLAVVAGVTWLVTRRALRPVEGIRAELAAITASGDLARRVPVPAARDEIAGLATATNATLAALAASVARQRAFVADASHELRSPIASLRTQLEVAQAHPELLDLDGAVADVVRLQHLAADLLFLARIDAGERPAARDEPVPLAPLVRAEAARPRPGPRPVVEIAAEPSVRGDRDRLARALGNLLDNAARHARASVRVLLRVAGDRAIIEVGDDGPGIPADARDRVFERFVRLDDARARDDGGAGLGLAIARDVVAARGGTLTVGVAREGGALLTISLPRS
ncbi:sensor histidine kinase [Actinomadura atramentaria]|uniref:sensor histidine kinase n=1 Tax=Actinomadura atramentaria TaxID=1990 RepID=UPI000377B335|nr:HAMP domain-containing sensor histidine kinase [Actinomadura atramentaria]